MKKIIPVLSIIFAVIIAIVAMIGLVMVCLSSYGLALLFLTALVMPVVIGVGVLSALSVVITAFLRRDILCKIAFFIDLGTLVVSAISIIIWWCAL